MLDVEVAPSAEVEQLAAASRAAKLHEVVLRFLGRALVVPTIVEVEQAHLMDAASAALFEALARELESSLVGRAGDAPRRAGRPRRCRAEPQGRIELAPLPSGDVRGAGAGHAGGGAGASARASSSRSSAPGAARSSCSTCSPRPRPAIATELPDSVGAATMARIDALDPEDGALVRRAAVLGLSFHPRRLADVLAPDMPLPDDRLLGAAVGACSPASRTATCASASRRCRRWPTRACRSSCAASFTERSALRLEREADGALDADAAVLSNHFALAGDYVRAHRYAMPAAKRATERFSHADAVRLYRRAIDAGRALGPRRDAAALAEAWEQLGEALRSRRRAGGGQPGADRGAPAAARRPDRAGAAVRPPGGGGRAQRGADRRGALAESRAPRASMRSRVGRRGPASARCARHLGGIRNRQGRWAEAIRLCRQAIAEAESVGELSALAQRLLRRSTGRWESRVAPRRPRTRGGPWRSTSSSATPSTSTVVLNNLGMFAYFDGRWDDALTLYRRARESGERAGTPADVAYTDCNIGEILSDQGRVDEAGSTWSARAGSGARRASGSLWRSSTCSWRRLATRRGDRPARRCRSSRRR